MTHTTDVVRCGWGEADPLNLAYHDAEWGVPITDDRALFELLCLEGAQAGLAWVTILRKREGYRRAFEGFEPERLAAWGEPEIERIRVMLVDDHEVVRRGLRGFLELQPDIEVVGEAPDGVIAVEHKLVDPV